MNALLPELFREIAEYTYDWETWVDASGVARWINPAFERITGYRVDDCLGQTAFPLALAHEDDRRLLTRVLTDAAAGGSGNDVEFRIRHKDGALRWVAISWQALRTKQGQTLGYRTSIRDIDERKRIEAELHVMRKRAEDAAVARSELLANVSHELRSPVHCIAGFADLLLDSPLDARQRRYVTLITHECDGMLRHVEDLLQLAAIEAGGAQLERRAFDLEELVRRVIEAAEPLAQGRELALESELAITQRWVEGDPTRVGQLLRNLVDNALKFTEQGSVRVVAASRRVEPGGDAQIDLEVRDTGCGMPAGQIERLLEPFQQAASTTTRRHGGVGLGLSIVRRLVNAMHGTLHIESAPGAGTRVRIQLRLHAAGAEHAREPDPVPSHAGEHALVIDDSAPARELLRAMLERSGYRVTEAGSGAVALACAAEQDFDLVLLDHQMPGADGTETAVALRRTFAARGGAKRTPIFLLTANVFVREQLGNGRAAIDGILEKPLTRARLSQLLGQLAVEQRTPRVARREVLDPRVLADLESLESADGSSPFVALLSRVRAEQAELLAELARAAGSDDRPRLGRLAHDLAGQAAWVGAREVARRARFFERRVSRGRLAPGRAAQLVVRLSEAWAEAESALVRRISEGSSRRS